VDGQWLILDNAASRWCAIRRWSDPSQNSCSMRTAHGASSRQIEPGRGQAPADRARPVSSGRLVLGASGKREIDAPNFCPHRSSRVDRGDDCCCLVSPAGRRGQRRARTHVSGGFAAAARSDSARRIHCFGRQSRRQTEAGYFFLLFLPPLLFLDGWRIRRGLFRDKGTILEWRSASSCSRSLASGISSTG